MQNTEIFQARCLSATSILLLLWLMTCIVPWTRAGTWSIRDLVTYLCDTTRIIRAVVAIVPPIGTGIVTKIWTQTKCSGCFSSSIKFAKRRPDVGMMVDGHKRMKINWQYISKCLKIWPLTWVIVNHNYQEQLIIFFSLRKLLKENNKRKEKLFTF